MTLNEQELVNGCRQRDRLAQKRLYDVFAGKMFAICLRYTKNRPDAEDVLQDAFIKIYENIDSFRGECPLEFWVRSVVVNTALKHLRKQKHLMELDDVHTQDNHVAATELTLSSFQWQQLMGFIHELPTGCQTVFNLYAIEGYQHNEIAQMMGISEGTSKSQYARARMLLQQKLSKEQRFDDESVRKTQL
ncbi:RNA polymerase sigma factor [Telluribacter sp. SYSU D00476]|uniref:RNA polymerase sigma factor n=1 Tax=Telluribacter sp. SYSU D00476 TaxID=2811430 RepID=UPI001FF58BF1|nr:RNA polymerase sigma factor [Telluribacter sp. SYSU D00476]